MSYANGTTHYNLPQTVGTDKRDWSDTNEAFASIDAAIYSNSQAADNASENITALQELTSSHTQTLAAHTNEISEIQNTATTQAGQITALNESLNTTNTSVEDLRNDAEDMITAYNEPNATSAHEYSAGNYFIYNNVLYKASTSIAIGDTIIPNTNCTATNVTTELLELKNSTGLSSITFTPASTETTWTEFLLSIAQSVTDIVKNQSDEEYSRISLFVNGSNEIFKDRFILAHYADNGRVNYFNRTYGGATSAAAFTFTTTTLQISTEATINCRMRYTTGAGAETPALTWEGDNAVGDITLTLVY